MGHNSVEDLLRSIEELEKVIPKGSCWIHYKDQKGEHPYEVLHLALEESTEKVVVVYKRKDLPNNFIWTRPVYGESGWLEKTTENKPSFKKFP